MKKILSFLLLLSASSFGQVRYWEEPVWNTPNPGDTRPTFLSKCPVNFTMPLGHPYVTVNFVNAEANWQTVINKGSTMTSVGNGDSNKPGNKVIAFYYDEWAHPYRASPNQMGIGENWLNHQTPQTVINAYMAQGRAGNVGMECHDFEDMHDMNVVGAQNMRAAYLHYRKQIRQNGNPNMEFGTWSSLFYNWGRTGSTPAQISIGYTADLNTIRANPQNYGFNGLHAGDLHPDTVGIQALADAWTYVIPVQYYVGSFEQDRTFELIQNSEVIHRVFPHLKLINMHQPEIQMSVPGGQMTSSATGWYRGNYRQHGDPRYQGDGVWAITPDMIMYDPTTCWNMGVWGFLYGGVMNWEGHMPSNDPSMGNYHGNKAYWGWSYFHLASLWVGGDSEIKSIFDGHTEVEKVEFSMDGGATWKTGNDLLPAYAQASGLPIIRAKVSADGSKAFVLGYHQAALNGAATNVKIKIRNKVYDFRAKRFTQSAVITL